jgi:hypothetical protein
MRISVIHCERIQHDIKRVNAALERLNGGPDVLRLPDFTCGDFQVNLAGRFLELLYLQRSGIKANIGQDRHTPKSWDYLAQEF